MNAFRIYRKPSVNVNMLSMHVWFAVTHMYNKFLFHFIYVIFLSFLNYSLSLQCIRNAYKSKYTPSCIHRRSIYNRYHFYIILQAQYYTHTHTYTIRSVYNLSIITGIILITFLTDDEHDVQFWLDHMHTNTRVCTAKIGIGI